MFAGLIIASGPPGARLRIGISIWAQAELKGPITATSSFARAYALAFAAQRAADEIPGLGGRVVARAVADRVPARPEVALIEHLPDCVRHRPWTGAMRPLEREVRGNQHVRICAAREQLAARPPGAPSADVAPAVLTHAVPSPAASPCTAPTGVASTAFVLESIRDTVPSL